MFKGNRRALAALLVCATAAIAPAGCAKKEEAKPKGPKVYRVAFASFGPDSAADNAIAGYLDGLKSEGIVEGRNLEILKKHAAGDIATLPTMMQSLDGEGLDLIVPMTTPGVAAAASKLKQTAAVFVYTYDPLAAGAGKSLTDHLPNMTGVASFPSMKDTVRVIRALVPGIKSLGTIYNASEANSVRAVKEVKAELDAAGIKLEAVTVATTADTTMATQAILERKVDAIWITGDNTLLQGIEGVLGPAGRAKVPVVMNDPEYIDRGAVAAVGIGWPASGLAAGKMAARVLRGESPAGIPIENIANARVVLNKKQAAKIGLAIPASLKATE